MLASAAGPGLLRSVQSYPVSSWRPYERPLSLPLRLPCGRSTPAVPQYSGRGGTWLPTAVQSKRLVLPAAFVRRGTRREYVATGLRAPRRMPGNQRSLGHCARRCASRQCAPNITKKADGPRFLSRFRRCCGRRGGNPWSGFNDLPGRGIMRQPNRPVMANPRTKECSSADPLWH